MIGTESKRGFKGFPLGFYYGLPYQPVTAGSNPARFRKGIDCSKTFKNKFEVRKMKKNELQEIADKLADTYGNGRHFEIIKAEKSGNYCNYWNLTIAAVTDTAAENDEGADDESE